jgi:glycosyltransferase involved in cell wall biosynthesis
MQIARPNKMIAMSKENSQFFEKTCKLDKAHIQYIRTGIDTDYFVPAPSKERYETRNEFGIKADSLLCVLPGRLNFVKGHDIVVDALRSLRFSHPDKKIVCIFMGGGDQEHEIHTYAIKDDSDAEQFQFFGYVTNDKLLRIYQAANIVLLPSRFEGFGLTVAEAMACGCVPIRTPSGGYQDQIIDGENGYIIPFNDSQFLAGRILELTNTEKLNSMREKATAFAHRNFNQGQMILETSDCYRAVMR